MSNFTIKLGLLGLLVLLCLSLTAQTKEYKIAAVGFYNFENLFDTIDTPDVRDTEFTPNGGKGWNTSKYQEKLGNLAYVINSMGVEKAASGISVLGVSEIENVSVLEDLVAHPALADKDFGIIHHDSPDERGIDVALLYRKNHFVVDNMETFYVELFRDNGEINYTRDVLLVSGMLDGEKMHFLVNHWPSRSGGEKRSEPGRAKAADVNRMVLDSLYTSDPNAKIIVMGDLNDNPTNVSVTEHLGAAVKMKELKFKDMYNPMGELFKKGYGSNAWRDSWSLFDQAIVSKPLLDNKNNGYKFYRAVIHNKQFLKQPIGQYKGYPYRTFVGSAYQGGYSDHFPVYVYLIKEVS